MCCSNSPRVTWVPQVPTLPFTNTSQRRITAAYKQQQQQQQELSIQLGEVTHSGSSSSSIKQNSILTNLGAASALNSYVMDIITYYNHYATYCNHYATYYNHYATYCNHYATYCNHYAIIIFVLFFCFYTTMVKAAVDPETAAASAAPARAILSPNRPRPRQQQQHIYISRNAIAKFATGPAP